MKKRYLLFTLLISATFAMMLAGGIALAASLGNQGLTISPPVKELNLSPNQKLTQTIQLSNPTGNTIELYPKVMDFGAKGETGEPSFADPGTSSDKYSLASWIKLNSSKVVLTAEQVVEFPYEIEVPNDAEPGGHYGVVFFANQPTETSPNQTKVALSSMVGSLILVTVPGDIHESGQIVSFQSDKLLYLDNKVKLSTRIQNLGNVHFKPVGSLEIKDIFGRTTDVLDFNSQKGNVLPSSTRKFNNSWNDNKILIGPYTVSAKLLYGTTNQALNAQTVIWIIPIWFVIGLAIIILGLVIWLVMRQIKKRKNNKSKKDHTKPTPPTITPNQSGDQPILR